MIGIIEKLIICIITTTSVNFSKNIGMIVGKTKTPMPASKNETRIVSLRNFLS